MKNLCALIPSYNEANTVGGITKDLKACGMTVYVIDDGSTDRTAAVAQAAGAIVISQPKNMGKGAALGEGFKRVLKDGFDATLVMDGDGQHQVKDVDKFLARMKDTGSDIIIGNRMADTASMPYIRVITNRFMSNLISRISKANIPDSQCGFRLIKKAVLEKIELESSNYETESELIIKAARAGFKIESVQIAAVYRNEKSRINPVLDTIRFVILMVKILSHKDKGACG